MNLKLQRFSDNGQATIGLIFIGNTFECFSLEDTFNEPKVYGKTRIPSGKYEILLRRGSPMSNRYDARYDFHDGMLWLQNVENFKWVYMHVGGDEDDTDGCVLVGRNCLTGNGYNINGSVLAYKKLYQKVYAKLIASEKVYIEII
ncbi:peptidoglycan hydrolase [Thiohalocapsa phage LS06-2018-MD03]|nr:peptidoglycan hydrolase [Thiohalocapsa phage LS06-2018-MD03]